MNHVINHGWLVIVRVLPSGNLRELWKITIGKAKSPINGPLLMAMLNFQMAFTVWGS